MNKVFEIGNLTADPELRTTPNGVSVCNFKIAVNRRVGENQKTDFFSITAWRGLADICGKYLSKGKKVAVLGTLATGSYEKDGVKHYTVNIVADDIEFLSPKQSANDNADLAANDSADLTGFEDVTDDDLPF